MSRKEYTKEEMEKRMDALPPEIKNLLYTVETENIIQQVGVKNRLHIDQTAMLMAETNEIMCGFADAKEFVPNLMDTLQIDRAKADAIAQDINDLLFTKIRESMKKVYEQGTSTAPAAAANPPAMDMGKSVVMPSAAKPSVLAPMPTSVAQVSASPTVPLVPKPVVPAMPAVQSTSGSIPSTPTMPVKPAPAVNPVSPNTKADVMLSEPTVSMPKPASPAPVVNNQPPQATKIEAPKPNPIYKADPYREPPE